MKSYNEMAASALQRIEEHEKVQERRKKQLPKYHNGIKLLSCGIGTWQFGMLQVQDVASQQSSTQRAITSTGGEETAVAKGNDSIFVNQIEGFSADKININLRTEDFVKMSASQLK